jgi:hypothetical protein
MFLPLVLGAGLLGALTEWQLWDAVPIEEVVFEAESFFNVKMSAGKASVIESVGDLYDAIIEEVPNSDATKVWEELKALLVRQLGVDGDEVVKTARFHYELS